MGSAAWPGTAGIMQAIARINPQKRNPLQIPAFFIIFLLSLNKSITLSSPFQRFTVNSATV
jgi:hypothetical protein